MLKAFLRYVLVLFVLSIALEVIGEVQFPDSLYIPRLGVKNNRAAGTSLPIPPGGTLLWADIEGPGILRHFWMTNEKVKTEQAIVDGSVTIRFYWDGHQTPDLEVPLNEFFGKKFTDGKPGPACKVQLPSPGDHPTPGTVPGSVAAFPDWQRTPT